MQLKYLETLLPPSDGTCAGGSVFPPFANTFRQNRGVRIQTCTVSPVFPLEATRTPADAHRIATCPSTRCVHMAFGGQTRTPSQNRPGFGTRDPLVHSTSLFLTSLVPRARAATPRAPSCGIVSPGAAKITDFAWSPNNAKLAVVGVERVCSPNNLTAYRLHLTDPQPPSPRATDW